MNRNLLYLPAILIILLPGILFAQEKETRFFMPLEIQKAYNKGTRSFDGKPGPEFWQNTADYTITVGVDPEEKVIEGEETVVYQNNSPEDLTSLVVRLYYDVYKQGNPREATVRSEDISEGVELTNVNINGMDYDLDERQLVQRSGTNITFRLLRPLASGSSLTFKASWKQKIPYTNRRTGVFDSTSFFIGYWYPQIAVYDDVFGWDRINYTLRTEFYNTLADYDVTIQVPENFMVWATGTFQNPSEVLPEKILKRYNKALSSEEVVHIVEKDDLEGLTMQSTRWHYTAGEVPDFAFAISDHFLWDAAIQKVEDRDVLISTAFPVDRAEEFTEVTALQQKTMQHLSRDIPGVPYPYEAFTTFIGLFGGGMEFPMMANNGGPGENVTIHELFHTYFPHYVRVNERRFAWMDEGWADYITALVIDRYFKDEDDSTSFYSQFKFGTRNVSGTIGDLPLFTSSQYWGNDNYGYSAYPLPSFIYAMLHQHLGDEMFLKCFREYINRWAKRSPLPYDLFYTFEDVSNEDLSWLWKPWFFEFGYPDLGIKSVNNNKLVVEKLGKKPVPLKVDIEYNNGTKKEIMESARIWANGKDIYSVNLPDHKKIKRLTINIDIPDVHELNNFHPPLDKLFAQMEVPESIIGTYKPDRYPITLIVEKEKYIKFKIPESNFESIIYPKDKTHFTSVDGMLQIRFVMEENECTGLNVKIMNFDLTAEKQ